ncbi:MAG: flavodoxin domain-containing protein [Dehalococcoidales bacterium]|nr:flavodoxin domain-containing protein [Dehalococcoidales bacterium]
MSGQALIVYGTRFGATAGTAEEIAAVLRGKGMEVKVVNAKKGKTRDISGYDLVIVGSGMMMDRWTGEPEQFLKRFQKELAAKRLALFVSSGAQAMIEYEGKREEFHFGGKTEVFTGEEAVARGRKKYLEAKAQKYGLLPVAMGLFGGVWDYNHMPWYAANAMQSSRAKMAEAGIRETSPGVYDTRDWEAIRNWAGNLAAEMVEAGAK